MTQPKLYDVKKFSTIKEMLKMAADESGDKLAFKYLKGKEVICVTYKQFWDETIYLGTALESLALSCAHVGCIGPNSYPWLCSYLTMLKAKGVFVPVDKELPAADIINVVNHSDMQAIFYDKSYEKIFRENREAMPNVKYFIGFARDEDEGEFLSYKKLIEKGKELYEAGNENYANECCDPEELKLLIYTSGTTGLSKGVELTEHNLVYSVYCGLQISRVYTTSLSVLPYHHTYEAVSGILVSLHNRCCICINSNLKAVVNNLKLFKPDFIYVVPAFAELFYKKIWATVKEGGKETGLKILIKLSNGLRKIGIDLRRKLFGAIHESFGGNLVKIVCGGAPLRAELGDFFDSIGISLINGYGITECSPLVSANREECNDCTTVGFVLPCLEVKIEDPDENGDGEIWVKGDVVMKGYYKMSEVTEEVFEDGWFKTGDYGRFNKKGLLMITGRKKNLIVLSNGKNIFPEEIENYILSIEYIKEAVVYAVSDEKGDDKHLRAEVFLDKDALEKLEISDVDAKLRADITEATKELPIYKKIGEIKVRETEFEKTTTNKIKRNSIKKD